MRYRDYCNITFEQIELMKCTISFNGTRLRGGSTSLFRFIKIASVEMKVM